MTWAGFDADAVAIADDDHMLRWYVADEGGSRGFCGRCGSPMFFKSERWAGELHVARALFRDPLDRAPRVHGFYETHVDWLSINDDLPKKRSDG